MHARLRRRVILSSESPRGGDDDHRRHVAIRHWQRLTHALRSFTPTGHNISQGDDNSTEGDSATGRNPTSTGLGCYRNYDHLTQSELRQRISSQVKLNFYIESVRKTVMTQPHSQVSLHEAEEDVPPYSPERNYSSSVMALYQQQNDPNDENDMLAQQQERLLHEPEDNDDDDEDTPTHHPTTQMMVTPAVCNSKLCAQYIYIFSFDSVSMSISISISSDKPTQSIQRDLSRLPHPLFAHAVVVFAFANKYIVNVPNSAMNSLSLVLSCVCCFSAKSRSVLFQKAKL